MERATWKAKLSYACGDIYGGGAFLLVGLLYLNFLTDIVMIPPAWAGSIFLIGKIWDAVSDPIMGVVSDRTKSPFGRRRVYFLIGVIPIFLSFTMLWVSLETSSAAALFGYYLVSYLFFNTSLTLVMIPYSSLLPAMTSDYNERTSFITVRLVFSNVSALVSAVLPMVIVGLLGKNLSLGYLVMGASFALFYALPYLVLFWGTYEKDYDHHREVEPFSLVRTFREFRVTFLNKSFRIYSGFFIAAQIAVDFVVTLFIYYLTYCLGRKELFAPVLGVLLIVQILSMAAHMKVSQRCGKRAPFFWGLPLWAAAMVLSLFITAESSPVFIFVVAILTGYGCSASIFVPWSVFSDLADVDELITDRRREGVYAGLSTLIRKISQAAAIFLIGVVLDAVGYVPNVEQEAFTLMGIKALFAFAPLLFIGAALLFASRYRLTAERFQLVLDEIKRRRTEGAPAADGLVREACEELTGLPYETLGEY